MGARSHSTTRAGWFLRFWTSFITEPLARFDREQRAYLDSPAGRRFDWKVMAVFITVAFALSVQEFLGGVGVCQLIGWLLDAVQLSDLADRILPFIRDPDTGEFEFAPHEYRKYPSDRLV